MSGRWRAGSSEAGRHCQRVHEHLVEQGQVDLQHVQADELWVKQVGGKVWMALALAVPIAAVAGRGDQSAA